MCLICSVIGISEINVRPGDVKIKDWIDDENNTFRQPIRNKILENISYYLGNAIQFASLRKAADALFERDYKDMKQIFVPEFFLTKDPSMIHYEKLELEKLLASRSNIDMTEEDVKKCRCLK